MAAPDFQTLLNFSDNLATAVAAVFSSDGLPAYAPRGKQELPKERLDVLSSGWARASGQMVRDAAGHWHYSHYAGSLTVVVISPRGDAESAARHGARVGRARYLLSESARLLTPTLLPYYGILDIAAAGENPFQDDTTDTDRTELTWTPQIQILPEAIPIA